MIINLKIYLKKKQNKKSKSQIFFPTKFSQNFTNYSLFSSLNVSSHLLHLNVFSAVAERKWREAN